MFAGKLIGSGPYDAGVEVDCSVGVKVGVGVVCGVGVDLEVDMNLGRKVAAGVEGLQPLMNNTKIKIMVIIHWDR